MVPDRFTRKVTGSCGVRNGYRLGENVKFLGAELNRLTRPWGELRKRPPGSPRKSQSTSKLRSWQPSDFPLFLWLIRSRCALFTRVLESKATNGRQAHQAKKTGVSK